MNVFFELSELKFIMTKNDQSKHLSQVVCCSKHKNQLDQSWIQSEIYYGMEKCIVCEVNE
jgi:hypothetical protein